MTFWVLSCSFCICKKAKPCGWSTFHPCSFLPLLRARSCRQRRARSWSSHRRPTTSSCPNTSTCPRCPASGRWPVVSPSTWPGVRLCRWHPAWVWVSPPSSLSPLAMSHWVSSVPWDLDGFVMVLLTLVFLGQCCHGWFTSSMLQIKKLEGSRLIYFLSWLVSYFGETSHDSGVLFLSGHWP